jgi:hypothetical protein
LLNIMSAFKLNDARQGLSTKGEGRSWGNQRNKLQRNQ